MPRRFSRTRLAFLAHLPPPAFSLLAPMNAILCISRSIALTLVFVSCCGSSQGAPQQIDSWLPEGAYGQVFPDSGDLLGIGCLTSGGGVCERVPAGSPTDWRYSMSGYAGHALCRAGAYYSVRTGSGALSCDWFAGNGVCYEPTDEAPGTIVCYPVVLTPGVTLSPASLVFASQPVGSTSAAQTVTVYSSGYAPLHVTAITASGDFQIDGNTCPAALDVGQWCQFNVRFAPTATGTRTGAANVYHDAPGGVSTVSLSGTGAAAVPALTLSPASLAFGTAYYGSASAPQIVTLANPGTAALAIASIATSASDFTLGANTCPASLAVGANCTVEVSFVPRSMTARSGQLVVTSNAPGSPHSMALSGTGAGSVGGWGPFDDANAGGTGGDRVPVVNALVTARNPKRARQAAIEMGIPLVVASALMEGNPGAETGSIEKLGSESDPDCNRLIEPPDPQCQDGECPGGCADNNCTPDGGSGGSQAGSPDAGGGIGDFIDDAIDAIDGVISGIMEAAKELFGFLDNLIGQFAADPVNTATGALVEEHLDYVGAGRFRLAFSRTYNGAPFVSSTHRGVDVGPGWSINWDRSIVLSADKTTARVVRGDGKSYLFTKQPNGTWNGGADMLGKLTWRADRSGNPLDWTYTDAGENRELYSAAGKLQSVSGRGGVAYTLTYDGSGRLSRVQNASGRALVLAYGASGRLASMTDPAGAVTTYAYDPLGRLVSVTYPDGRVRGYRYEDARFAFSLTAIVDAAGTAVANFTYDDSNRVVAFSGPNGTNAMTFSYQQGSTAVTDASGTTRTRQVTQNLGKLQLQGLSATCAGCGTLGSGVGYDANGFLTSVIDRRGMETRYAYNSRGLPTSVTRATGRPEQRTTTIAWHATFRLPVTLAEPTRTTAFEYNAAGRLTAMTRTAGGQTRTWRYEYDAQGRLTRAVGPRTDVTQARSFSYDAAGNVATLTNEMGQVSTRGYDAHGRLVSSTDANGRTQSRTLDASGRILSTTGNGLTTTYAYNSRGRLASVTAPDGSTTTYIRDSGLRISGIDRGNGEHVRYTREARGLVTKVETFDAAGQLARVASTAYDAFGRVSQSISAEGRAVTYQYDSSGNVTQAADALGNVVTMGYDALNRPILVTDALNGQVSATYNSAGLTASVTDPRGLQTSYGYSGQGDPTSTASPDAGASSASFNAAGNVVTSTDARGKTTSYTYDALGRLTRASFADASAVTYTYDIAANGVGLLARVDDPSGSTAYTYDAQGRTATRTVTIDGVALATLFGRDSLGRV
ncbi:MAG: choice-of-anchor D domain-containing protein, partial [Betaproteobacteria bacterium]|nr:choice-of-anchor D domain-containing protein [Betaproteobacteria bacterium]